LPAGPKPIDQLCHYLLADVRQFAENQTQNDDICLVAIQRGLGDA
jgi:serine phosphatase RsbU (regulator of sigma subunit)